MQVKRWSARAHRWQVRDEAGQSGFEFLLTLPFIFVFLFLMVEGAAVFETWSFLEHASREGARCAAVRANTSTVTTRVQNSSGNILPGGGATIAVHVDGVTASPSTGTPGHDTDVTISGYGYSFGGKTLASFLTLVSGHSVTPPAITLNAVTHMRLEQGSGSCP